MCAVDAPANWWETFFSGLAVQFWRAAVPPGATAEELEFLWRQLRLSPGSRVLDVPCGAGRVAIPLAEKGCAMTGVDISEEFLAATDAGAGGSSPPVRWRQSDMRDLPWKDEFDAAFCFGNSFGYLDDAGNEAFLGAMAQALRTGGRFAIDYGQAAESILPRSIEPRTEADIGGFRFVEETRYEPLSGRIENVFEISAGGKTERKLASQRVYTVNEITRLLARAGLRVLAIFGSPSEEPFRLGSPRLLVVAEKGSSASSPSP